MQQQPLLISVSSLFGSNKVKRLEEENKQLKADKTTLEGNISTLKKANDNFRNGV